MSSLLAESLRRQIRLAGPISLARFMAEALGHPDHGYYMTRDPLGAAGDFVTAPEVSQMFGELIGLWCAEAWRLTSNGAGARLVELGPGRGTLMADALRAARLAPDFRDAATIHLVETSPVLVNMQQRILAGHDVQWHARFAEVPAGPAIVIANEFFDALPVHQLQRTEEGWRERMVGLAGDGLSFELGLAPGSTPLERLISRKVRDTASVGDVAEVSPAAIRYIEDIAGRIAAAGGAALIIDYGYMSRESGETLQALRGHKPHDPLKDPGTADLTAHVNFAALAAAAERAGAVVHGPLGQGDFLSRLGIGLRATQLMQGASPERVRGIRAACHRLIAPEEMGTLFKAMALTAPNSPVPPAFESASEVASTA